MTTGPGTQPPAASVEGSVASVVGVVLAGGQSRRWGGRDKTAVPLAGRSVLLHVLEALPDGVPAVVVGPPDHPARAVSTGTSAGEPGRGAVWTREEPVGGGPVAGLAAALAVPAVRAAQVVVVLAGDLPFTRPAVARLVAALTRRPDLDGVIGRDPDGHRQPLLAAYRGPSLAVALDELADAGPLAGLPLRAVLDRLSLGEVAVSQREAFDLDHPQDLAAAELLLHRPADDEPDSG